MLVGEEPPLLGEAADPQVNVPGDIPISGDGGEVVDVDGDRALSETRRRRSVGQQRDAWRRSRDNAREDMLAKKQGMAPPHRDHLEPGTHENPRLDRLAVDNGHTEHGCRDSREAEEASQARRQLKLVKGIFQIKLEHVQIIIVSNFESGESSRRGQIDVSRGSEKHVRGSAIDDETLTSTFLCDSEQTNLASTIEAGVEHAAREHS